MGFFTLKTENERDVIRIIWLFLLFFCLFNSFIKQAFATPDFSCEEKKIRDLPIDILSQVEKSYLLVTDVQAKFLQNSTFVGAGQSSESSGEVYFKKPGMMDWKYVKPIAQRFISNGELFWFFEPELQQVTLSDFQSSFQSDLPVSFLLGVGNLSHSFTLKGGCVRSDSLLLELSPISSDASLVELKLQLDSNSFFPKGVEIVDVGGNKTSIILSAIDTKVALEQNQFHLDIPLGVDVIDLRSSAKISPRPSSQQIPIVEKDISTTEQK